ncbi:farnesyl pyrophosphate synthase-like isoform X2 [Hyperolius riggenbachi]|uniref:farnesyl pyrophosphate synthase-like isoform X2 n=1 Tax=Hyperolius riggenbachi TaxID=752182 RepID=UPI0035A3AE30
MSTIQVSEEHPKFRSFFETIVKDLTAENWGHPEIGDVMSRLKEVLEYSAAPGHFHRGMTVLASFQELAGTELQKDDILQRVLAVSWCVELNEAFILVADDIVDQTLTRLGQPCWYRKDGIGLGAVNDACLLESCTYQILRKYCRGQPYYLNLLELFLEASYQVQLGVSLDFITSELGKVNLEGFTETRYRAIAKYKNGFYSYYLPVAAAMYMARIDDEEAHQNALTIFDELGVLFQIQDDYEDCYGDPSAMGEMGTDIQENKCSWLVVEALKRATPEQRRILEVCRALEMQWAIPPGEGRVLDVNRGHQWGRSHAGASGGELWEERHGEGAEGEAVVHRAGSSNHLQKICGRELPEAADTDLPASQWTAQSDVSGCGPHGFQKAGIRGTDCVTVRHTS